MKNDDRHILNRELSWLEFNARILEEASDPTVPLLERMRFLAIFSGNLDEFHMIRVAGLVRSGKKGKNDPAELLEKIDLRTRALVKRQYRLFEKELLPALEKAGIVLRKWENIPPLLRSNLRKRFVSDIFPVLTPIGIDKSHPFPHLPNLGLEMLIRLHRKRDGKERYAVLEVPQVLSRFIEVEHRGDRYSFLALEDLIAGNLDLLFSGFDVKEVSCFRITRDMNFSIDEGSSADLLAEMRNVLRKNAARPIIRLEISRTMSAASKRWLFGKLELPKKNVVSVSGMLNLKSCFEIATLNRQDLLPVPFPPLSSIRVTETESVFDAIRRNGSFLLHHPYESFSPVQRFLEEAADDPAVLAIKQTLYRVGGDSPVVRALIRAARNGKQVTVLVELRARFDEENNINWAEELNHAGANVIYGVVNLKVHCKTLLVVRRENDGIRRYVHIGTGNYNDKTARQYTDLGFFTVDHAIAEDISSLFNVITGFSVPPVWNRILASPFNLMERILFMIDREAGLSTRENPGSIRIKVNALIDHDVIRHLCAAAEKHVRIELAVRGICGLDPASLAPQFRKNITIVSILDRFLEHSRIYRFGNNGMPEYYLGSSDLMPRNLKRRIEVLVPVENAECRRELDMILSTVLSDRRKGRLLIAGYRYTRTGTRTKKTETVSAQTALYEYYRGRLEKSNAANSRNVRLDVLRSPGERKRK